VSAAPAVSVCIPTRNRADWLGETVRSVLAQTYTDLEVCVSDNLSDDHTQDVLRSFDDPRLRHSRSTELLPITVNWNRAFAMARGRYLTLLPDDDLMVAENLAGKVRFLEENPRVGLVHSRYHMIDAQGKLAREDIGKYFLAGERKPVVLDPPASLERLLEANYIHESTTLFRRECMDTVGEFMTELRFSADWNYWMRIAFHFAIGYLPRPLILWRDHGGSSTQQHIVINNRPTMLMLADRLVAVTGIERYVAGRGGNIRSLAARRMAQDVYDIGDQVMRGSGDGAAVRRAISGVVRRYPELLLNRRVAAMLAQSIIGPAGLDRLRHAFLR
jgi:glycosyltransferase involved in cell wall biosynthesis